MGGAGREAGFHCVSRRDLVAVEEEQELQNCSYHTSEKVRGELEAVSAYYEQVVSKLESHLISE